MAHPDAERRRYARHPIRVPLAVRPGDGSPRYLSTVCDVSEGGMSFVSGAVLPLGSSVEVELSVSHHRFTLAGTVRSYTELGSGAGFRVGLAFVGPQMAFRMKLAEQLLRIEQLRQDCERERGAAVTLDEATKLWVERYAETFADLLEPNEAP